MTVSTKYPTLYKTTNQVSRVKEISANKRLQ